MSTNNETSIILDDIATVKSSLKKVEGQIEEVEAKIQKVEEEIDAVAAKLNAGGLTNEDLRYWRDKETRLRDKETRLRDKETRLLDEKTRLRDKENILLQRLPPLPSIREDQPFLVPKTTDQQDQMFDVLADRIVKRLKVENGPTKTASTRGREEIETLHFANSITQASLDPNLPPILTTDALARLHDDFDAALRLQPKINPSEAAVTALLTPVLTGLVQEITDETHSGLVLSNTEYIQWLPPTNIATQKEYRKPDLLTAHPAMLVTKNENGGPGIINFRKSIDGWSEINCNFGGVKPHENSVDLISSLWEGKFELGNMHEALGEMVDYVKCVVIKDSLISFVLYDKNGFVGGYAKKGQITELVANTANKKVSVIPWDAPGSKDCLKKLLKNRVPERMILMENIIRAFNATWKPGKDSSPHLGSGGFGDVYRVEVNRSIQALKVAKKDHLKSEFETLQKAFKDKAPVVEVLVERHNKDFSAYTMVPVGTPFVNVHSVNNVSLLFSSLFDLHSSGWYHGDARWQNAMLCGNRVLWCDFRCAHKSDPLETYYRIRDLLSLAGSLLNRKGVAVPAFSVIEEMLGEDATSYGKIADLVSTALVSGQYF